VEDPATLAVNCWFWEDVKPAESGVNEMLITAGGVLTVKLIAFEFDPAAFAAHSVNMETPAAVGVPLMMPVEDPSASPAGSLPLVTLHVRGLVPVAVTVWE
jgi:hypothetical protein